jgi:hypothetical protein
VGGARFIGTLFYATGAGSIVHELDLSTDLTIACGCLMLGLFLLITTPPFEKL